MELDGRETLSEDFIAFGSAGPDQLDDDYQDKDYRIIWDEEPEHVSSKYQSENPVTSLE